MSDAQAPQDSDLQDVARKLHELAEEGRTDELIAMVVDLLARVREDNTRLQSRLQTALRQLYGRKSEKISADQLSLFFDDLGPQTPEGAQQAADEAEQQTVKQPDAPPQKRRGRKGRNPLPEGLPRETRDVPVPEGLRDCGRCGHEKDSIGVIRSELLEFVPSRFIVIEERREKLACKRCGDGVVSADTEKPMDRGRPGPGLLAHLLVSKGQDSLPLYRQSQIYERCGVSISPSTLGEWFAFACDALVPLWQVLRDHVLSSLVIRADDTGIRVLDRSTPKGVKLGHMWGYVGDGGIVVFDYTPTWEAKGPAQFLEGFDGWLQGDGYAGFKKALERQRDGPIVEEQRRLGCAMHIRRKFEYAAKAGDARGAVALAYFRKLYEVERACKQDDLTPEQRKARRDEKSLPVLNEMYDWIRELHASLVPGDKLHEATRYAINQEDALRRCFDDGRFEIDNGEVERQLRRVALGRKNYLFAGSDKGANRLAVAYTLLGSCHMLGVDPLRYLTDVLDKIQNGWPQARVQELLPTAYVEGSVDTTCSEPDAEQ
jgi:transposase